MELPKAQSRGNSPKPKIDVKIPVLKTTRIYSQ